MQIEYNDAKIKSNNPNLKNVFKTYLLAPQSLVVITGKVIWQILFAYSDLYCDREGQYCLNIGLIRYLKASPNQDF